MGPELGRYVANQVAKIVGVVFFFAFIMGAAFAWFLFLTP